MKIGIPKEIKTHEYRVGLVPQSVTELTAQGHTVIVETKAGQGIGFSDEDYLQAGAHIYNAPEEVFAKADMIVKVKEPLKKECELLRKDQIIFTFLHLAPDPEQARALIKSQCIAIAYETVTNNKGQLPLLAPMTEVAGRMPIQVGAHFLEKGQGGSGVLLSGVAGVEPGKVTIVGGGVVGTNAARLAVGMGAQVTILDNNVQRLAELDWLFQSKVQTVYATKASISHHVKESDLVIGAVLVAGGEAPKIVTEKMIQSMRPGSVVVDVAIDQGGCFETSRPTTHTEPVYQVNDVIHYCVTNMPGAVARTSSKSLNNATLPFVRDLADKGYVQALKEDPHLLNGLNVFKGKITCAPVAEALGYELEDFKNLV